MFCKSHTRGSPKKAPGPDRPTIAKSLSCEAYTFDHVTVLPMHLIRPHENSALQALGGFLNSTSQACGSPEVTRGGASHSRRCCMKSSIKAMVKTAAVGKDVGNTKAWIGTDWS